MKNFIQWNYERGTWQYDVFCLLIVAFIFLTPKAWFEKREKLATQTAQHLVKAKDLPLAEKETNERISELNGNDTAENYDWREKKNAAGEIHRETDTR